MVTSMRRALKKPLFRDIIVWAAVLSLSLSYTVPELIRRFTSPSGAITVNDVSITPEDFQAEVSRQQRKIAALYRQYGQSAKFILEMSGLSDDPTSLAYKVIIRQALLDTVAQKYNLKIDSNLVNQEISRMLPGDAFSSDGKLNLPLEFVEEIKSSLQSELIGKMVLDFVDAAVYVPTFEVKAKFAEQYSKRNFSVLSFSFDKYLEEAKVKAVTDKELAKYYSDNKANYHVEEKRGGKVWHFDAERYGIAIKPEEIKAYYSRNKPKFKDKPAEVKVARILIKSSPDASRKADDLHNQLLKDPANFDELAKQHSEDTASAPKCGALDYFKRGDKDTEFENAAFALSKDNPISSVVNTKDGYEIIKLLDKKNATFKDQNSKIVYEEIKAALQKERFKKLFPISARKAMHSKDKAEELAKLKEKGQQGLTFSDMPKGESKDIKKLFSLKSIGDFDFFMDGDRGAIVQLDKVSKAYTPALKDIKDEVKEDYYKDKALANLKADVAKADRESATKSFGALKDKFKATTRNIDGVSMQDSSVLSTLSSQGLPAAKMMNLQLEGSVISDTSNKGGYLVKLAKINPIDQKLFEEKKGELKQLLAQERKQMLSESFIASLKKDAKISINDDRLKNQLKGLL